jgi:peptide/nickel transport system substrate-binding protein
MDPQLSYTGEGWMAMYNSYIPLLTYRHAGGREGSDIIPGLAKTLPKITDGGRTYTLFLRDGLRYSNGRKVRASDFKFAVERMFKLHSGGSHFYEDIVGAPDFAKKRRAHVSGIATNDRTGKIVIHLVRPRATFSSELALLFVAPVPPETPMRNQTSSPPPATGPYVITRSSPPFDWTYARNPEWNTTNARLLPQIPGGHIDQIHITITDNLQAQVKDVEEGKLDWMYDPPPGDRFAEVEANYAGTQFRREPSVGTYYFWMNTRRPPFDNLDIRRAVNYAVDAKALRRIYAGQLDPSHQILPVSMPGYRKFELYPHSMDKARQLIAKADPTHRHITVWTDSKWPDSVAGSYYAGVLRQLGFSVQLKVLSMYDYFKVIGNPRTPNLDTGFSMWLEDYPHPNSFFQPLLASRPQLFNNTNYSQLQVPKLNSEVAQLDRDNGPIDEGRYAALDRSYMELAPIVPFGSRVRSVFVSKAIDLDEVIWNPTFEVDLTSFRFK